MKGPLEKGELFAVLEHMKGGQVVTHPCAPVHSQELEVARAQTSP